LERKAASSAATPIYIEHRLVILPLSIRTDAGTSATWQDHLLFLAEKSHTVLSG
jgi:hypothetical protein